MNWAIFVADNILYYAQNVSIQCISQAGHSI